jgi:protein-L-isoaspartate(D-aspartate) O-methyltransferase
MSGAPAPPPAAPGRRGSPRLAEAARRAGVRDPAVLDALLKVPRASYVPPQHIGRADRDQPVPIPHGQVTSQPSLIAAMLAALRLDGDETVLEIGTGYGFQTALLARLARTVWSVEWFTDLAEAARANLAREKVANARVRCGDGTEGIPEAAPFDAIVISAAFPEVPPPLVAQLAPGGRLVQPIGHGGAELVTVFVRGGDGLRREELLIPACFVRLLGRHGYPPSRTAQ